MPEAQGTPEVDFTETLCRQVKEGGGQPLFFDESRYPKPVLNRALFLPNRQDVDGLSLIRLRFRTERWAAFRPTTPDQRFLLARLNPEMLAQCGAEAGLDSLTIEPDPDALDDEHGEPWAHCVVREINVVAYKENPEARKQISSWANLVSTRVAREDVSGPYDPPVAGTDPYRP